MKIQFNKTTKATSTTNIAKNKKNYKEDTKKTSEEEENEIKGKFGVKSIRKILRTLCDEYPKEEMNLMVWVSYMFM